MHLNKTGGIMNKQIVNGMSSPFTGGLVYLVEDTEVQTFRKEEYRVCVRYYVCADTGEQFTTDEQDEQLCNELYNQYRVRYGIPFPDEIKKIREKYQLSFSQITKITGFGQNQWRQYENGCVPSESNGKSIVAISSREGMLTMLEACKNQFDEDAFLKIKKNVLCAPETTKKDELHFYFYGNSKRDLYNGYSEMNAGKLQSMVQLIVSKEQCGVSKTKLNKEMFYADFSSYKKYGRSISGLSYRAIKYGPVPEHYETVYDHIAGLTKSIVESNDMEYELLHCDTPDTTSLGKEDIEVIDKVMSVLAGMSRADVVALSHSENGWLKNKDSHGMIPYDEAYTLKGLSVIS